MCRYQALTRRSCSSIISKNSNLQQFFGLLDVFSGGSFKNFSVLALGVYPYITASIVVQLLQGIIPRLGEMNREGESGRNRLAQITRYIAVPLAMLQAFSQMAILVNLGAVPAHAVQPLQWRDARPDARDDRDADGGHDVPGVAG